MGAEQLTRKYSDSQPGCPGQGRGCLASRCQVYSRNVPQPARPCGVHVKPLKIQCKNSRFRDWQKHSDIPELYRERKKSSRTAEAPMAYDQGEGGVLWTGLRECFTSWSTASAPFWATAGSWPSSWGMRGLGYTENSYGLVPASRSKTLEACKPVCCPDCY